MFKEFRVKNKQNGVTHTDMTGGKFIVKPNQQNKFHQEMAKQIIKSTPLHITETHNGIAAGPILVDIDLDFKLGTDMTKRAITNRKILEKMYTILIRQMQKDFQNAASLKYHCYILVKPTPYQDHGKKRIRDGVHMIFPEISTTPEYQEHLRQETLKKIEIALKSVGHINTIDDVYDKVVAKSQFLMYGNHKPKQKPYELKLILNYDRKTKKINNLFPVFRKKYATPQKQVLQLLDKLSIRNKKENVVLKETLKEVPQEVPKETPKDAPKILPATDNLNVENFEIQEVRGLLALLSIHRAESYHEWIKLGWCLHNINADELLPLWIEFSKRSPKFQKGECEKIWRAARDEGYNILSLRKWAEEDSPTKYKKFYQDNINYVITQSTSGTHNDVANLMYQLYKEKYVCTVNSKGAPVWYEFKNQRWYLNRKGLGIRKKISTDIVKIYYSKIEQLREQANKMDASEPDKKKALEKTYMGLYRLCRSLKDSMFKSRVLKECVEYFQDDNFLQKLDANPQLLAFENGVFDFDQMEFREGRPQDYISMTTGFDYDPNAKSKELVKFLKSVMPIREVRDYLFTIFSLTLCGCTYEQMFPILSGVGSNGKSSLLDLLSEVLGDYFTVMPVTAVSTNRSASNACTPELANLKGKRCVVMNEPNKGVDMNLGKMKEWTGGDKIQARALYSDPIEFKLTCIFFLVCNNLPEVNSMDQGTWRRLRNINFPSRFVSNPNPANKYEYKIDTKLPKQFAAWAPAFTNILIDYHRRYLKHGLKTPDRVVEFTKEYQVESDYMQAFVNEYICAAKKSDFLSFKEVNVEFLAWHRENYPAKKSPPSKELKQFLKTNVFRQDVVTRRRRQGWFGYRLVNLDSDSDAGGDDLE